MVAAGRVPLEVRGYIQKRGRVEATCTACGKRWLDNDFPPEDELTGASAGATGYVESVAAAWEYHYYSLSLGHEIMLVSCSARPLGRPSVGSGRRLPPWNEHICSRAAGGVGGGGGGLT